MCSVGFARANDAEQCFSKTTPNNPIESMIQTQNHSLALNLTHRNEEEIPVDSTITTFLRNHDSEQWKDDEIVKIMKRWADGKTRPHDGSYFAIRNSGKFVYPEYL